MKAGFAQIFDYFLNGFYKIVLTSTVTRGFRLLLFLHVSCVLADLAFDTTFYCTKILQKIFDYCSRLPNEILCAGFSGKKITVRLSNKVLALVGCGA